MCMFIHTELSCTLNQGITQDLNEILTMDSLSSLEYVKDTLTNLIRTYHEHRLNEDYYEFQPTEGYEKSLQKLEREVREHIKIEHQMRLHIDNIQARLDESEKLRNESNSQSKRVI